MHLRLSRGTRWAARALAATAAAHEREWTIPGASRGEAGVLGEGIRQALLRDPTYVPALEAARAMLPRRAARVGRYVPALLDRATRRDAPDDVPRR